jgi:ABC-type Fe3+-citrate transport system substrate-binding protein
MTEDRLRRIETKLDQLADAMAVIARMDEKLISINTRIDRHEERLNGHSKAIDQTREELISGSSLNSLLEKAFWLGAGVIITAIVKYSGL